MGCADCHTPLKMGANGPEPDITRNLSGHPAEMKLPPPPSAVGPWTWGGAGTNTAFWGPWGISFSANLTGDKETGLGQWTLRQFVSSMRTGKHMGVSRPIAPPMPWQSVGQLSDGDLRAMLTYLQSTQPVRNQVPPFQAAGK